MGVRVVRHPSRFPAVRFWTAGDVPAGGPNLPNDAFIVEWVSGEPGHPSSYALLGLTADRAHQIAYRTDQFTDALVGPADEVHFGLTPEYLEASRSVVGEATPICLGAHGTWSSSIVAFRVVGTVAVNLMSTDVLTVSESAIWDEVRAAMATAGWYAPR